MGKNNFFSIIIVTIIICLFVILAADLFPLIKAVAQSAGDEASMVQYIDAYGVKGVPILISLQALQIVIAVIPSLPFQILTGLCYGVWLGTLISIAGCIIGNLFVFVAMRHMKEQFSRFFKRESKLLKILSQKRLATIKNPALAVFFFCLIPVIPNGLLPYVFAATNIPLGNYLAAVAAGTIPSAFLCNYLGSSVTKGNYFIAVIIAVAVLIIVLAGILFKNKLLKD